MKKMIVFCLMVATIAVAQDQGDPQNKKGWLKRGLKALGSHVQIIPPTHYVGYETQGHVMSIKNGTRLYCDVVAYGSWLTKNEVGNLDPLVPGETLSDVRHYETASSAIPLLAECYEDKAMTAYVGVAGHVLQLNAGNPEAIAWTIQESEIRTPQGGSVSGITRPNPDASFTVRKTPMPRELNATGGYQLVNNTLIDIVVSVNNGIVAKLHPQDIYFHESSLWLGVGANQTIHLDFVDRGRLVGTLDDQLYVPESGVFVKQSIVSSSDIRRIGY